MKLDIKDYKARLYDLIIMEQNGQQEMNRIRNEIKMLQWKLQDTIKQQEVKNGKSRNVK